MFFQLLVILVLLIPILTIVLDSNVGRALASRLERRGLPGGDEAAGDRVSYLEGEVDRLSKEITRLDEESQFLHKLLAERPSPEALPKGDGPKAD